LARLISDEEAVDVDPIIGPGTQFPIQQAGDGSDLHGRPPVHRIQEGDFLQAGYEQQRSLQPPVPGLARVDAANPHLAAEPGLESIRRRRTQDIKKTVLAAIVQQPREPATTRFRRHQPAVQLHPLAVFPSQFRQCERFGRGQGAGTQHGQIELRQLIAAANTAGNFNQLALHGGQGKIIRVEIFGFAAIMHIQLMPPGVVTKHLAFEPEGMTLIRWRGRQLVPLTNRDDLARWRGGGGANHAEHQEPQNESAHRKTS
jgi:hypothetical protein